MATGIDVDLIDKAIGIRELTPHSAAWQPKPEDSNTALFLESMVAN